MSGGTFEAVTLRLGILHALRENGVLVWNDARAIERCVDKSMTSFLLARAGIPTPATWAVETQAAAQAIVRRESPQGPLVLKPLFGSQGRGLKLIRTADELPAPDEVAGVYYLQRYVGVEGGDGFRDFRLLVSRGRVVAAMTRHAAGWITNVKQGGRPLAAVPDREMKELAVRATAGGRGRVCRRRHPSRPRWAPDRARGQQHAGLVGPAEGHARQHRRGCSQAILSPRSRRGRSAGRRRDRACGKSCRRLQGGLS